MEQDAKFILVFLSKTMKLQRAFCFPHPPDLLKIGIHSLLLFGDFSGKVQEAPAWATVHTHITKYDTQACAESPELQYLIPDT